MASKGDWGRAVFGAVTTLAMGYGVMRYTTPSDQEFYDKLSPELKKQVDMRRNVGDRQMAYAEQLKRAREEEEESPLAPRK